MGLTEAGLGSMLVFFLAASLFVFSTDTSEALLYAIVLPALFFWIVVPNRFG
ncbi:MAG: hypothetical protein ABH803_01090 [Candidatus Micrarchaeota archaeon]